MGRAWKERGFWKLVKWQKGFSTGAWKRLSEIWSSVITSTPFLPSPCSPSPSPKFSCQREVQKSYVRWWGQVWALPSWLNECDVHGLRAIGDALQQLSELNGKVFAQLLEHLTALWSNTQQLRGAGKGKIIFYLKLVPSMEFLGAEWSSQLEKLKEKINPF